MNISCSIIADLLPLYHDGVCNGDSARLVDTHIASCGKCKSTLEEMKDNKLDSHMKKERDNMLENHIGKLKKSLIQGVSIAMIVTIITTFAVNFATSGTLSWFYFVLSGALLLSSLTIVPLLFEKHRGILTLISSVASLLLLLFTINYIVDDNWFWVAAISVLLSAGCSWLIVSIFGKKRS
ncbi:MAG: zf-HC2 domain-containing protein [Defluviitaleaceae bacterium]|nr:zf-HC2 domain-containing protein [Defluviitaleaceae bacterium]